MGPDRISSEERSGLKRQIELALREVVKGKACISGQPKWLVKLVARCVPQGRIFSDDSRCDILFVLWDGVEDQDNPIFLRVRDFVAKNGRDKLVFVPIGCERRLREVTSSSEQDAFAYDTLVCASPNDAKTAKRVAKRLQHAKAPKAVARATGIRQLKHVAVSTGETLTKQDEAVLGSARTLIVLCSPEAKLLGKNDQAIALFAKRRGRRYVQAALTKGEPKEAFPDRLLQEESYQDPQTGENIRMSGEPLASNLRDRKGFGRELLRLKAPLFGCSFDDLFQRRKQKKRKTLAWVLIAVLVAGVGVTVALSTLAAQAYVSQLQAEENRTVAEERAAEAQEKEAAASQQAMLATARGEEALVAQSRRFTYEAHRDVRLGNGLHAVAQILDVLPSEAVPRPLEADTKVLLFSLLNGGNVFPALTLTGMTDPQVEGDRLYCLDKSGTVFAFDLRTGEALGEAKKAPPKVEGQAAMKLTLPDGNRFEIDAKGRAMLTDAQGALLDALQAHTGAAHSLVSALGGKRFVSSTDTETIVWGVVTGDGRRTVQAHAGQITDLWIGQAMLATCGRDGKAVLFDLKGKELLRLDAKRPLSTVEVREAIGKAVTCAEDGTVMLWDITTGKLLWRARAGQARVARLSPDGSAVVAGMRAETQDEMADCSFIKSDTGVLLDGKTGARICTFPSTGVSRDGEMFLEDSFLSRDVYTFSFRDLRTGKSDIKREIALRFGGGCAPIISKFGDLASSWTKEIVAMPSGVSTPSHYLSAGSALFCVPSPALRQQMFTAMNDFSVMIDYWIHMPLANSPFIEQYVQQHLYRHKGPVRCIAFSNDGVFAISASDDGTVAVFNKDELVQVLQNGPPVACAYFLPDDAHIVTVDASGCLRFWPVLDFEGVHARAEELMKP